MGTTGAAYVRGLERAGVVATLKHFAGYSASRGGRNLAPVPMGPRELADVILPPFEMALRHGGARSVMNSYAEIDGLPVAADHGLLTGLLRDEWGFTGTVVADYFSVRFLETLHGVADGPADAARLALRAGIDVELPTVDTFGTPLVEAVRRGEVDEALIDGALRRVLIQKIEIGLLDEGWQELPDDVASLRLDDEASQDVAVRLAREAVVLLRNTGVLPLPVGNRVALVGPVADDPMAMLGCYSFPNHVGVHHSEFGLGLDIPSLRDELARRVPLLSHEQGCTITGEDTSGIPAAVAAAAAADVCVLAVGDRAGMFGRGTSGEGCDAADLRLPGVQADLVRAVLATGTPVVLVLMTGRPYALGPEFDAAAAVVQAFFLGQLGGQALAEVLTGAVNPSGRLPVSVPRDSRRTAEHLPGTPARPAQQGVLDRPDAGLPVRSRAELHHLRLVRRHGCRAGGWHARQASRVADRRRGAGADHCRQHRRPGRHRGGPALPARPGRADHPPGGPPGRLHPTAVGARRGGARDVRCTGRRGVVHRAVRSADRRARRGRAAVRPVQR